MPWPGVLRNFPPCAFANRDIWKPAFQLRRWSLRLNVEMSDNNSKSTWSVGQMFANYFAEGPPNHDV